MPIATPERAVEHAKLAETLAAKGGRDNLAVSAVLGNWVGMQIRRVGCPARTLPYHLRALERAIEAGAKDTEALCLLDISATLGAMGDEANSPELFLGVIDVRLAR